MLTGHGVDLPGHKVDTIKFAHGSFRVTHSPGKGPQSFDPKSCLLLISQHGTYKIGHGTGTDRRDHRPWQVSDKHRQHRSQVRRQMLAVEATSSVPAGDPRVRPVPCPDLAAQARQTRNGRSH